MSGDRLELIKTNLRNKAINLRIAALNELANLSPDLALPILAELIQEVDFGLRRLGVMGLGNHQTEASWSMLQQILQQETDANVLAEAANSLYEFGDRAIAPLLELYQKSDNWLVRQTVISILADSDRPEVLLKVGKLALKDNDQTTREAGILALSRLLDTNLKSETFALFETLATDPDWRTRWRTAIALTASQDPEAKQLLAQLQQDDNYRVVAAALDNL